MGSSINLSVRMYTTNISSLKTNLSFIIGFTDAEGSLTIYMRKDPRYSQGWQIKPVLLLDYTLMIYYY